eukprot:m.871777 g.871777  ORF g.871777 m.871777 type:complete len:314 (-) comp59769_c1_seq1:3381-4322(-)
MSDADLVHPAITQEQANGLLRGTSGYEEGVFLVRTRGAGQHVLSVVHKAKPSHHLITRDPAGLLLLNNTNYGPFTTLHELVLGLSRPVEGWPVLLLYMVPIQGWGTEAEAFSLNAYFHPNVSKEEAEALLGVEDGRFLVRLPASQLNAFAVVVQGGRASLRRVSRSVKDDINDSLRRLSHSADNVSVSRDSSLTRNRSLTTADNTGAGVQSSPTPPRKDSLPKGFGDLLPSDSLKRTSDMGFGEPRPSLSLSALPGTHHSRGFLHILPSQFFSSQSVLHGHVPLSRSSRRFLPHVLFDMCDDVYDSCVTILKS